MKGTLLIIKLAMNAYFPTKTKSRAKEDQSKIFAFYITLNFTHIAAVRFDSVMAECSMNWLADAVFSNCSSEYAICTCLHTIWL